MAPAMFAKQDRVEARYEAPYSVCLREPHAFPPSRTDSPPYREAVAKSRAEPHKKLPDRYPALARELPKAIRSRLRVRERPTPASLSLLPSRKPPGLIVQS